MSPSCVLAQPNARHQASLERELTMLKHLIGLGVIRLAVDFREGWIERFGHGLQAVVDVPGHRQGAVAVPGVERLAEFFGALVFAGGVGNVAAFGVVFVDEFVSPHDRELHPVNGQEFVECQAQR